MEENKNEFIYALEQKLNCKLKIGQKIKCINPEHQDDDPSMHIYIDHCYCFGCGFRYPQNKYELKVHSNFMLNPSAVNVENFQKIQPFFWDDNKIFWIWDYDLNCYKITDEFKLISMLDKSLQFYGTTILKQHKQEYIDAFKLIGLQNRPKNPEKTWVQFGNYITDIKVGHNWGEKGFEPSSKYFLTNPIQWNIGKDDSTPTMDKLFTEWVGEKYVNTLYEILAYCCLSDLPIHICFCLIGSGRNGKSQFQRIISKFIGNNNCSSTELDLLVDNRFESFKLYKKLVCQLGETNFGLMNKTSLFKKLTGGDLIGFEKKNKDPFDDYTTCKLVINSNSLPTSTDTSEGFYRRWLIINFPNEFPEGKDIVATIPDFEFENLARKCITLLPKLLERGSFTNQGSIEERKQKFLKASNPFSSFVKECCIEGVNEIYIKNNDLYNAYCQYLKIIKARVVCRKEYTSALNEEGHYSYNTTKKVLGNYSNNTLEEKYDKTWWVIGIDLRPDFTTVLENLRHLYHLGKNFETLSYTKERVEKSGINGINDVNPEAFKLSCAKKEHIRSFILSINPLGEINLEQLRYDLNLSQLVIDKLLEEGIIFHIDPITVKIN